MAKVMIIDDNPQKLRLLTRFVEREMPRGFEVLTATTYIGARQLWALHTAAIKHVVSDANYPMRDESPIANRVVDVLTWQCAASDMGVPFKLCFVSAEDAPEHLAKVAGHVWARMDDMGAISRVLRALFKEG